MPIIHDEQYIKSLNKVKLRPCICTTGLIGFSVIPVLLDFRFYLSSYPSSGWMNEYKNKLLPWTKAVTWNLQILVMRMSYRWLWCALLNQLDWNMGPNALNLNIIFDFSQVPIRLFLHCPPSWKIRKRNARFCWQSLLEGQFMESLVVHVVSIMLH